MRILGVSIEHMLEISHWGMQDIYTPSLISLWPKAAPGDINSLKLLAWSSHTLLEEQALGQAGKTFETFGWDLPSFYMFCIFFPTYYLSRNIGTSPWHYGYLVFKLRFFRITKILSSIKHLFPAFERHGFQETLCVCVHVCVCLCVCVCAFAHAIGLQKTSYSLVLLCFILFRVISLFCSIFNTGGKQMMMMIMVKSSLRKKK